MSSERRRVHRAGPGALAAESDSLIAEAPLELRVAGEPVYVTMRTPGDDDLSDIELLTGLLVAEGVIDPSEWERVKVGSEDNVVVLDIDSERFREAWPERSLYASSACGVCGATAIDALAGDLEPIASSPPVSIETIAALPDALRAAQPNFKVTGASHAAGLFDVAGNLLASREDVGRHNAVDKVVGWAARMGKLPASDCVLAVSGRVSFEIAHKAVRARVPVVVAVSAPTTLAVDVAERFRLTICGFVRDGQFNVYSHARRLADIP